MLVFTRHTYAEHITEGEQFELTIEHPIMH